MIFLDKLVGLVVELPSPVFGIVGSSPASVSLSPSQIYNINISSKSVLGVISLLAIDLLNNLWLASFGEITT